MSDSIIRQIDADLAKIKGRVERLEVIETVTPGGGGHPPVTINAGSDPALSLTGPQELNLDLSGMQVALTPGPDIDITVATLQREGRDVLLFSGSGALLLDYPGVIVGLLAAAGASVAGDVIEMPAGTIVGDFAVPAGVILRGRGWQSILEGQLTLGAGAGAEHLKVFQDVDTADDIIGIIGPATGEATIRDVQVSLNQAGAGKALGLLSAGGTLRAYECEVWVSGATGSVWGIAAATGGIVEMNQGQVRAWWI